MMDMKDSDDMNCKLHDYIQIIFYLSEIQINENHFSKQFLDEDVTLSADTHYISDNIKVLLIPEKRGTFLKHTEYEVINSFDNKYCSMNHFAIVVVLVDYVGQTQKQSRTTIQRLRTFTKSATDEIQ